MVSNNRNQGESSVYVYKRLILAKKKANGERPRQVERMNESQTKRRPIACTTRTNQTIFIN